MVNSLKPFIIGTVAEDALLFIHQGWPNPVSPTQYVEAAFAAFRNDALKILERFPVETPGDQRPLLSKVGTRWVFACTNRILARQAQGYM